MKHNGFSIPYIKFLSTKSAEDSKKFPLLRRTVWQRNRTLLLLVSAKTQIDTLRINNLIYWIESESSFENITSNNIRDFVNEEVIGDNIFYANQAPPDTDTVKWSDNARKQFNKKLPPDWRDKILKVIRDFLDKNKSNHNDHALKNGRAGQRALDIPGTGPGRGTGRIVYEPIMKYGKIVGVKIIEFITDHKY